MQTNNKIHKCRVCGSPKLVLIGKFGNQYLSNFPDKIDKKLPMCPLDLVWCKECKLLQLQHTANLDYLYKQYWYVSGINQTMKKDLAALVNKAQEFVKLEDGDVVVDIGSNDSTLLKSYKRNDIVKVGFEPAKNLIEMAQFPGGIIINDYFNYGAFNKRFGNKRAKIITAAAMFYDLEDPNEFIKDICRLLDESGVFIVQLNYLPAMFDKLTFDNISHEHLEYYCLMTMKYLFDKHDLDIFDFDLNNVNGGSIRIYSAKKGKREISVMTKRLLETEKKKYNIRKPYKDFAEKSSKLREKIYNFVKRETKKGKTIYILGASTRGNALLQACNLDSSLIRSAADRNPMKFGRYMVGSWIPIISEEQARKENPDYFLVLPWQFREEIIEREKEYLNGGGKLVFIFPKFEIVCK